MTQKFLFLVATALAASTVHAASDCTACRPLSDKAQYLACMKGCLSEVAPEAAAKNDVSDTRRNALAQRAAQFDWKTASNTDTVTSVATVTASKNAIEPLTVAEQSVDVTLAFSANSKSEGGLYLRLPDLESTKSLPFLSVFDNVAINAVFGASVTARVDKNPAAVLSVQMAQGGVYLKGSEALLNQMTTGGLLTVRLSGSVTQDKDIYFDLRGFAEAVQWVQLGVGGIKEAPPQETANDTMNQIQKLFNSFLSAMPEANESTTPKSTPSDKSSQGSDLMKF